MSCPRCHRLLVRIAVRVREQDLELRSCSYCDQRSWFRDDGETTIDDLRGHEPARR